MILPLFLALFAPPDQLDRTLAAWTAQILAANMGFAFEHKPAAVQPVTKLPPDFRGPAPVDDDYYYELVALRAFEHYGPALTIQQLGEQWKRDRAGSWGSSELTRLLLDRGVQPPDTGHPRYNRLWFTIGPQFSADIFGMLAPGQPERAARLARYYTRINGHAEAVEDAAFVAAMVSLAFTESDSRLIVEKAARLIDPRSPYRQCLELVLFLAHSSKSPKEIADAVEDRWHVEYPATNNAVANGGIVALSVYFGEGDFFKTLNLAVSAADFTDADCNAANAAAVVGAMRGMKGLPATEVARLNDRIAGNRMGPITFDPPIDERISDIAQRTVNVAGKIAALRQLPESEPELFTLADLTRYWNPAWTLERAGFGGAGGGLGGIRGLTYLDGDTLVTWPRDEVRGLLLRTTADLSSPQNLTLEVGAAQGGAWRLDVYANNERLFTRLIEGGMQTLTVPLPASGVDSVIRLYQHTLVGNRTPGSALWRKLTLSPAPPQP